MGNASGLDASGWDWGEDLLRSTTGDTDDDCVSLRQTLHRWSSLSEIAATGLRFGHTSPVHTGVRIRSGMESSYELSTNALRICWAVSLSMMIKGPAQRGHSHWIGEPARSALGAC